MYFITNLLTQSFFASQGTNEINEALTTAINEDGRIHLVAASSHGVYFLRFAVCSPKTTKEDVKFAYEVVREIALNLSS